MIPGLNTSYYPMGGRREGGSAKDKVKGGGEPHESENVIYWEEKSRFGVPIGVSISSERGNRDPNCVPEEKTNYQEQKSLRRLKPLEKYASDLPESGGTEGIKSKRSSNRMQPAKE